MWWLFRYGSTTQRNATQRRGEAPGDLSPQPRGTDLRQYDDEAEDLDISMGPQGEGMQRPMRCTSVDILGRSTAPSLNLSGRLGGDFSNPGLAPKAGHAEPGSVEAKGIQSREIDKRIREIAPKYRATSYFVLCKRLYLMVRNTMQLEGTVLFAREDSGNYSGPYVAAWLSFVFNDEIHASVSTILGPRADPNTTHRSAKKMAQDRDAENVEDDAEEGLRRCVSELRFIARAILAWKGVGLEAIPPCVLRASSPAAESAKDVSHILVWWALDAEIYPVRIGWPYEHWHFGCGRPWMNSVRASFDLRISPKRLGRWTENLRSLKMVNSWMMDDG
ncbi:hypothetical protein NM208_g11061 [Fusarium decemcellulare]|uniref:Uncharacterized protein n=1 Tax=Fusarium decemcellulare TaxID=57161 RepID=A0ACC1RVN5_9HYPO|nr:hypothetical protein NM208_g11061 [Fusarium decemcellulare]